MCCELTQVEELHVNTLARWERCLGFLVGDKLDLISSAMSFIIPW